MSKGNMLLGQARGSVGDLTFYRRDGQQITRAKVRRIANPRTSLQIIQRMIFGTVVEAYKRTKSITDHSFEGVQAGAKSQSRFMSLNLKRLRDYYPISISAAILDNGPAYTMSFAQKSNGGMAGTGLILSSGSLPSVPVVISEAKILEGFGVTFTEAPTIQNVMTALNARVGDQITVCALSYLGNSYEFQKSRYVINANARESQLAVAWDATGAADAFDSVKTDVGALKLNAEAKGPVKPLSDVGEVVAVACIISRKSGNTWLRSESILYNMTDEAALYQADYALPSWEDDSTVINAKNDRYLNNAELGE